MTNLESCQDKHKQVFYYGDDTAECPVCVLRLQLDEMIDGKEDIDQENIFRLFNDVDTLKREVKHLQEQLEPKRRRNLLPF